MHQLLPFIPGGSRFPEPRRRSAVRGLLLALLVTVVPLLAATPASADTSSSLTIVGTSDVSDSGLMPNLILPAFEKAFPQFNPVKYVGSATGTAIQNAENGTGGPSVLIVHAASLENQFVANGYSYNNQFGNAIFTNDFVLAGPTNDPAAVQTNGAHNIAQALADVATAGAAGRATFYTRGGTSTASGTTVEEHQLWALVHSSGLQPPTLVLCDVSAADGGGMSPIKSTVQASSGEPCPDSGTVNGTDAPSWYFINAGANQGANVIAANSCTQGSSGPNSCYVLTDRGTFDYLASGTDPAGTIPNLKIVSRDNSASAPGGANALINYFHAYIINPSKPGESVNLTAAQDFVNFLTSPTVQSAIGTYLDNTSDPGGAPFRPDASPILTAAGLPGNYHAGKPVKVTGTLTNAEPGWPEPTGPALAGKTVSVAQLVGGTPVVVAKGTTDSSGHYAISFVPASNGSYEVETGPISQIEIPTLNPQYGDVLSPAATAPVTIKVYGATSSFKVRSQGGKVLVTGTVKPGTGHTKATVSVFAHAKGKRGPFHRLAVQHLAASQGNFAILVPLKPGPWQIKVKFQDPGQLTAASTRAIGITVKGAPASSARFGSLKIKRGTKKATLTVTARVSPVAARGNKVELLGLNTTPGQPARFVVLGTIKPRSGETKLAVHSRGVGRGARWVLQLEYVRSGQPPSFSKLRTASVH